MNYQWKIVLLEQLIPTSFFAKKQIETGYLDINSMPTSITTDELGVEKFNKYDGKE